MQQAPTPVPAQCQQRVTSVRDMMYSLGSRGTVGSCHRPPAVGLPLLHGHSPSSLTFTLYSSCSFVSDLLSDRSCVWQSRACHGGTDTLRLG